MNISLAVLIISLLAQQPASVYDVEKERALGQELASGVRRSSPPLGNKAVEEYVNRVGADLVAHLQQTGAAYSFEVVLAKDVVEPMPLPGGFIFVPARFLLAANDEAEFAGMIAHSIGHIALRHGLRTASRGTTAMASIPLVFASHVDSHQPLPLVPMAFLKDQRERELDADRFALELLARAGYDAKALRRYIERIQAPDRERSPLPPRELRLAKMDETLQSLPMASRPSTGDFQAIQRTVRDIIDQPKPDRPPTLRR